MTISVWNFAFLLVFMFFIGAFCEWIRKDVRRMEDTSKAYRVGYFTGYQTAELKFAPSRPEPEDFENWPTIPITETARNCFASGVAGICRLPHGHQGAHVFT